MDRASIGAATTAEIELDSETASHVSLCHQCDGECEDPQIGEAVASAIDE